MNKAELVKAMNTVVMALNDEGAYYNRWIYLVPDQAEDDDFDFIAEDDELYEDVVRCFMHIMNGYSKNGIYCDGVTVFP